MPVQLDNVGYSNIWETPKVRWKTLLNAYLFHAIFLSRAPGHRASALSRLAPSKAHRSAWYSSNQSAAADHL